MQLLILTPMRFQMMRNGWDMVTNLKVVDGQLRTGDYYSICKMWISLKTKQ